MLLVSTLYGLVMGRCATRPSGSRAFGTTHHTATLVRAATAGSCTLFAVIHGMPFAFFATEITHFGATRAEDIDRFAAASHIAGR